MSNVNITVYDGKSVAEAAQRAEVAAKNAENSTSFLIDPIAPGTEVSPAVIPDGPAGQKRKFEPEPGFYQGFPEVTADKRWSFYWTGSAWTLQDMGELPSGNDGTNGVDGASLLKLWSTTSSDYPYGANIAVRDPRGFIYISMVDDNTYPLTDETKWASAGYRERLGGSDNIFEVVDSQGNIFTYVDGQGFFRAKYQNNSIPRKSIDGLDLILDTLKATSNLQVQTDNLIEITSPNGEEIYGHLNKKGVWSFPKKDNDIPRKSLQVTKERKVFLQEIEFFTVKAAVNLVDVPVNGRRGTVTIVSATGKEVIKFNVEVFLQGHGSLAFPKKNLTFDLYNADWQSCEVKFGYMQPADSFHLKGYWTDTMHCRDVGAGDLWYQTLQNRPFPSNMFVDIFTENVYNYNNAVVNVEAAARFTHIGYRCAIYIGEKFFGLYTWRQKKARELYAVNRDNPKHIFIDSQVTGGVGLSLPKYTDFEQVAIDYEFRSPRNIGTETEGYTMRFFNWCRDVVAGTVDMRDTYEDYIDLYAWIDWIIVCELIGHYDVIFNNAAYITYNGLIWKPLIIDTDMSVGIEGGNLINASTTRNYIDRDIFINIKSVFAPEFRERYAKLKDSGIITPRNIFDTYRRSMVDVPLWTYQEDYNRWGCYTNGTSGNKGIPDLKHLMRFINNRIQYLENTWG